MENLPKYISGVSESEGMENTYVNCNICRNFSNILKLGHRKSKEHQKKMTEKFRTIKNQVKMIGQNSVTAHDEQWQKYDSLYCYFCDKSVEKHKISDGLMIESLGYMTHFASPEHAKAVKSYLKYHERKEKCEIFCKTEEQLNKFLEKVPQAKEIYLKKLEILHMKDVQSIREAEENRKKLVEETMQNTVTTDVVVQGQQSFSVQKLPNSTVEQTNKPCGHYKLPPWQSEDVGNKPIVNQISVQPVIGPTVETLIKHVASQKKKGLPVKRLGANIKHREYSAKWMPTFRGVWNKGKRKTAKSRFNQKI